MKKKIVVCNSCLRASCIKGYFFCDNAVKAGTVQKTITQLEELDLESPKWWDDEC